MREARLADVLVKAMLTQARQVGGEGLGRADEGGKAGLMHEARQGRYARQFRANARGNSRQIPEA
jgi:hypothetical protein